jgi:hypothetical protein
MTTVNVSINSPASGDVSGNGTFTTYGTDNVNPYMSVTMSAWVINANTGATVATGEAADPPTDEDWEFKFADVPVNVACILNVEGLAADGTSSTSQIDITCT